MFFTIRLSCEYILSVQRQKSLQIPAKRAFFAASCLHFTVKYALFQSCEKLPASPLPASIHASQDPQARFSSQFARNFVRKSAQIHENPCKSLQNALFLRLLACILLQNTRFFQSCEKLPASPLPASIHAPQDPQARFSSRFARNFVQKSAQIHENPCKTRFFYGFLPAFYCKTRNPTFIITQTPKKINREACTFFSLNQFRRSLRFSRKQPPQRPPRPLSKAVQPQRRASRPLCKRRR